MNNVSHGWKEKKSCILIWPLEDLCFGLLTNLLGSRWPLSPMAQLCYWHLTTLHPLQDTTFQSRCGSPWFSVCLSESPIHRVKLKRQGGDAKLLKLVILLKGLKFPTSAMRCQHPTFPGRCRLWGRLPIHPPVCCLFVWGDMLVPLWTVGPGAHLLLTLSSPKELKPGQHPPHGI